jgi:MinD-like ATPase involved in chromosome partitioning or flagellar assembly/CheY-like chemotaxis protein
MAKTLLTILLIEDSTEYAELVKRWLAPRNDIEFVLDWKDSLKAGLNRLAKGGVDAVLLDLGLQDSRPDKTFPATITTASGVPIVILSGGDTESLALKMVEEGAQDYIVKSTCNSDLLVKTLQFAVGRSKQKVSGAVAPEQGTVIAVMGAKGGVGTTTVAFNVATVLARQRKVILVEMRPTFGTLMTHLQPQGISTNLSRLVDPGAEAINPADVGACLWTSKSAPGLRILFGPQTAAECAEIEGERAKALIRVLGRMADVVIVDLPSSLSVANRAVIELSNSFALVVERDPVCLKLASLIAREVESWNGAPPPVGAVIVNRVSFGNPMPMADVETILRCHLLGVIPPAADSCLSAQRSFKALVTLEPDSLAAGSMKALAETLAPARTDLPLRELTAQRMHR